MLSAAIIDGQECARALRERARAGVAALAARGTVPRLFALGSAADPDAERYLKLKASAAADVGIVIETVLLPPGATTDDALVLLDAAALDAAVHAMFVQYPLPGIDMHACIETIPSLKDVDGASSASRERLRRGLPAFLPATAAAILELVRCAGVDVSGRATVIAPGDDAVAEPLALALAQQGAEVVRPQGSPAPGTFEGAALVVFPGGVPAGLPPEVLPDGAVVIDAGYTIEPHGSALLRAAAPRLQAYVPPRRGVGPVVVEMLLLATLRAAESQAL